MDLLTLCKLPYLPFTAEDLAIIRDSDSYLSGYLFLEGNELVGEERERIHRVGPSCFRVALLDTVIFTEELSEAISMLDHITTS